MKMAVEHSAPNMNCMKKKKIKMFCSLLVALLLTKTATYTLPASNFPSKYWATCPRVHIPIINEEEHRRILAFVEVISDYFKFAHEKSAEMFIWHLWCFRTAGVFYLSRQQPATPWWPSALPKSCILLLHSQ